MSYLFRIPCVYLRLGWKFNNQSGRKCQIQHHAVLVRYRAKISIIYESCMYLQQSSDTRIISDVTKMRRHKHSSLFLTIPPT